MDNYTDINKRNTESFRVALEKAMARISELEEKLMMQNNSISTLQYRINEIESTTNMLRFVGMGTGATNR